ncbi:MAG: SAM-dependent chlorinase/fluorinase [Methylacidiphilales bacterium]|nr:SAM-dependent chlorinase/fluorinase [Candidatus Methylacidiphilales bacterium]
MPLARIFANLGLGVILLAMNGCSPSGTKAADAPEQPAPMQPVIALFTDYGWEDPYVAQLKGAIIAIDPSARLVDLTHTVTPFNVVEGAYLLDQSAEEFPAGTIFVAVVDPQVGTERASILLETAKEKFYVGPDNGLFSHVIDREGFLKAWKLDKPEYFRPGAVSYSFHGRDIFGPIAAHLAAGVAPEKLGTEIPAATALTLLPEKAVAFSSGTLTLEVEHIDRYGNVILNLSADSDFANRLKEGNLVKVTVAKDNYSAPLVKTYGDIEKGRLILLYGGSGLLEIAVNQGSAAKELKVQPGDVVLLKP